MAVRFWAFNQGFYNLFLAAGPIAGLVSYHAGHEDLGRALVVYACAFMAGTGIVLFVSGRSWWRSIGASGPPFVALIATPL